jgi:hypothetical protein
MVRPWKIPCMNCWQCDSTLCSASEAAMPTSASFNLNLQEACILICLSISFNTPLTGTCELLKVNASAGHARHAVQLMVIAESCVLGCAERLPLQATRVFPCRKPFFFKLQTPKCKITYTMSSPSYWIYKTHNPHPSLNLPNMCSQTCNTKCLFLRWSHFYSMSDYNFHWSTQLKSELFMYSKWFNCINLQMRMRECTWIVQLVGCDRKQYNWSDHSFFLVQLVTPSRLWRWDNSVCIPTKCLQLRNQH